jgi:hypothetical protein
LRGHFEPIFFKSTGANCGLNVGSESGGFPS